MAKSPKSRVSDDVPRPHRKGERWCAKEPADSAVEEVEETVWLARIPQENPDPVLRVSAEHVLLYSNPAGEELRRAWGCHLGQKVPAAVQTIVSAALADGAVARRKVAFASRTYALTAAPSVADGYVTIYARDITDCQQAQEALRQAEKRFRTIFDTTSDGIFLHDLETLKLTMCNKSFLQMLGYTEEEFAQLSVADLHPEADLPFIHAQIEKFLQGGKPIRHDIRFKRKDGSILFADVSPDLVQLDGRRCVLVALKDITERKRMEEELRQHTEHLEELVEARTHEVQESERKYRSLAENAPDIIQRFDRELRHLYVNPPFEQATGLSPSAVIGKTDRELGLPEDLIPFWEQAAQTVFRTGESRIIEFEMPTPSGPRHYEAHLVPEFAPDGSTEHLLAITRDITEHKQAQEALREKEYLLSESQRIGRIGSWSVDLVTHSATWTRETYRLFGVAPDTFVPSADALIALLHPDDRDAMRQWIRAALAGAPPETLEFRVPLPDGSIRVFIGRGELIHDDDHQPIRLVGTAQDVTERMRAQESLRFTQFAIDHTADAAFWMTEDGRFFYVNEAACRALGYSRDELLRMTVYDIDPAFTEDMWRESWRKLKADKSIVLETVHRARDGRTYPVEIRANYLEFGGRAYDCAFARDITERKQAEAALRESEERKRTILQTATDGFCRVDLQGRLLEVNDAYCRMSGYDEQELLAMNISALEVTETPADTAAHFQNIMAQGEDRFETWHRRKDGRCFPVEVSAQYQPANGGYLVAFLRDITERKRAEEALQESEARYRSLYHSIVDGIFVVGAEGQIEDVNDSACAQLGYTRDELIGMPLSAVSARPDFDLEVLFDQLRMVGSLSYETAHRRKDDAIVPVELSATLLEYRGRQAVLGVARDITERQRAEETLRESEAGLAAAQRLAHIGSWRWNIAADTARWSEETFRIFGIAPEPLQQHRERFLSRVIPEDRQRVDQALSDALSGVRDYDLDYRIRLPDGRERVIHAQAQVLRNSDGQPLLMHGTIQDITERKRAEDVLRESEERFRTAFEEGAVAMTLTALDTTLLKVNSAFCRMLGFSASELVGKSYTEITHPDDRASNLVGSRRLASGEISSFRMEKRYIRKDGAIVWGDMNTASVRDDQGRPLYCVTHVQDITERRQAEEALRRLNEQLELQVAQRTEELRRTVDRLQQLTLELSQAEDRERRRIADILHDDVQQTLAAAKFHLNLLSSEPRSVEESQEIVRQVRQMLKDAIEKSRRLSHELSPALYQVDLTAILEWLARHMQEKHGLTVRVEVHGLVDSPAEPLKAFLYKVVQELLFNVVKHAGVREARIRVRRLGPYLYLAVVDRGRGFDPQRLGATPGFGLLGIRERVQLLGGRMKIKSARGAGSTLLIALPYEPAAQAHDAVPAEYQDILAVP